MISPLIRYKSKVEYRSLDFDANKQIRYPELRVGMAKNYADDNVSMFGPVASIALHPFKEEKNKAKNCAKESKDLTTKGQNRVMERLKEIRQNFSKALVSGSRSGSGKIVYEFYDKLITLWKTKRLLEVLWNTRKFIVWIRRCRFVSKFK